MPDLGGWDAKHAVIHALTAADHHHDPPYPRPRPARYDRIPPLEERERMRYEAQQKRARQHQGKGSGITAIRSAMQRRR